MRYHVYSPLLEGYLMMDVDETTGRECIAERAKAQERCYLVRASS